jgi:hypothetical protein
MEVVTSLLKKLPVSFAALASYGRVENHQFFNLAVSGARGRGLDGLAL